jgi:hypothetical protein
MAVEFPPQHEQEKDDLAFNEQKIWLVVVPIAVSLPCLVAIGIFIYKRYRKHKAAAPRDQDPAFDTRQRGWYNGRQDIDHAPSNGIFSNSIFQHSTEERSQSTPTIQLSRPAHKLSSSTLRSDGKDKHIEPGVGRRPRSLSVELQRAVIPKQMA